MTATDQLKNYVKKFVELTEDELDSFAVQFNEKKIKKKQFLVQPDFHTRCRYFVIKGALRSYFVDDKGDEHTMQFAVESWWLSDFNAYMYQQPATLAEERYNKFAEDFPFIVFRVPQYMLASYLGMTTVFLSRIRNKKLGKKS